MLLVSLADLVNTAIALPFVCQMAKRPTLLCQCLAWLEVTQNNTTYLWCFKVQTQGWSNLSQLGLGLSFMGGLSM